MGQITINIVNHGSIMLQVTVRDLLAGAVPPVLPPTWIEPKSPAIPLHVEARDNRHGSVRWSAQNEATSPAPPLSTSKTGKLSKSTSNGYGKIRCRTEHPTRRSRS